jgi:hypothetical protein
VSEATAPAEPMCVERVRDENGSHIEPPLNELWTNHAQLRWHLAVVLYDLGLPPDLVSIEPGHLTVGGFPQESYVLALPGRFITTGGFHDAWRLITALEIGYWLAQHWEAAS